MCAVQRLAATPGLDNKSGWHWQYGECVPCALCVLLLGWVRDTRDARVGGVFGPARESTGFKFICIGDGYDLSETERLALTTTSALRPFAGSCVQPATPPLQKCHGQRIPCGIRPPLCASNFCIIAAAFPLSGNFVFETVSVVLSLWMVFRGQHAIWQCCLFFLHLFPVELKQSNGSEILITAK